MKRITVCIALAVSSAVCAEEPGTLPEVEVSAEKLQPLPSLSNTGLDARGVERRRTNTSDTARMLDGQPGVSVYGAGGVSSLPVIHGMADDRVRVKVDGMDLIPACPNHMNSPLSYIDPTSVGSVGIFAGIAPVSMSGDSIGGSILVDSAAPEFAAEGEGALKKGEIGAFFRSNGSGKGGNLAASLANQNQNLSYSLSTAFSGNYHAAANFKPASPAAIDKPNYWLAGDVVGSTRYKSENQSLMYALRKDNHVLDFKYGWQYIPYEAYPNQRMDMLSNSAHRANLHYSGQYGWGSAEARAYHEIVSHYMDFGDEKQFIYGPNPPSTIIAPGMPMYTRGINTGLLAKASRLLSERDIVRTGAEVQRYRLNDWWPPSPASLAGMFSAPGVPATFGGMAPNIFWNINNGHRDRLGVFGEWEARWSPQWLSLFGARVEQVHTDAGPVQGYNSMMAGYSVSAAAFNARSRARSDTNLDLTALARLTQSDTRTIEFGYALKTRTPNLYERYSWSQNGMALEMNNFVGDGNGYLGNPDLKPEQAHTLSATIDWHDADQTREFKLTPYYTHVSRFIDAIRCVGSGTMMNALCGGVANNTAVNKFVHLQYANQSARFYGIDVSGHMPLANASALGELGFNGVLNYVNGKNLTSGDNLYNIMPLNTRLALTQKTGGWNNSVELQLVVAKKNVSAVRQEVKTGGYGLLNLHAGYEWKQVRINVDLENALNKFYYLPLGGAYVGQGMTMSVNGIPWGIPVPGMGRSLNAGVSVKF